MPKNKSCYQGWCDSESCGLQWPLVLASVAVWASVYVATCYKPWVFAAKALKYTWWAPQTLYLAFTVNALASTADALELNFELPCLCDKLTPLRAAQAAVRLTLAPTLAMVTLASSNRFNQPFTKASLILEHIQCI